MNVVYQCCKVEFGAGVLRRVGGTHTRDGTQGGKQKQQKHKGEIDIKISTSAASIPPVFAPGVADQNIITLKF
jgi:hypothetical protein